jgi:hypothetical protein
VGKPEQERILDEMSNLTKAGAKEWTEVIWLRTWSNDGHFVNRVMNL